MDDLNLKETIIILRERIIALEKVVAGLAKRIGADGLFEPAEIAPDFARRCAGEHHRREGNGGPPSFKAWSKADWIALATVKKRLGEDEAWKRWIHFLENDDPFYAGHLPRIFLSQLGKFAHAKQAGRGRSSGNMAALQTFIERGDRS